MAELGKRALRVSTHGWSSKNRGPDDLLHRKGTALEVRFTALMSDGVTPLGLADVASVALVARDSSGEAVMEDEVEDFTASVPAADYAAGTAWHASFFFTGAECDLGPEDGGDVLRLKMTVTAVMEDGSQVPLLVAPFDLVGAGYRMPA